MDLSLLQMMVPDVAKWLHLSPVTLLFYLVVINRASNIMSRAIPQDATGWQMWVRRIAAILGTYLPSKVTSGVTVVDVASRLVGTTVNPTAANVIHDAAVQPESLIPEVTQDTPPAPVVPAFPGLVGAVTPEAPNEPT